MNQKKLEGLCKDACQQYAVGYQKITQAFVEIVRSLLQMAKNGKTIDKDVWKWRLVRMCDDTYSLQLHALQVVVARCFGLAVRDTFAACPAIRPEGEIDGVHCEFEFCWLKIYLQNANQVVACCKRFHIIPSIYDLNCIPAEDMIIFKSVLEPKAEL